MAANGSLFAGNAKRRTAEDSSTPVAVVPEPSAMLGLGFGGLHTVFGILIGQVSHGRVSHGD